MDTPTPNPANLQDEVSRSPANGSGHYRLATPDCEWKLPGRRQGERVAATPAGSIVRCNLSGGQRVCCS